MSGNLSSVWGHSVHFARISGVKIFKRWLLPGFHPIPPKLYGKPAKGGIQAITYLGHLPKILWHFEFFVKTGPYGAGNFKTLLLQFSANFNQTLWGHWLSLGNWEHRPLLFLAICQITGLWFLRKLASLMKGRWPTTSMTTVTLDTVKQSKKSRHAPNDLGRLSSQKYL